MNVLVIHNLYQQRGGEDRVVELETALLERHGHRVSTYILDNREIEQGHRLELAARTLWNPAAYRHVRRLIARDRPDVVHVHNTMPLASPAVYYAARRAGVPVVQTLHNYRLVCPNAFCLRDGRPCTACVGKPFAASGVAHACYRGSRAATATLATMLTMHRAAGTWREMVDAYIAPTAFTRNLVVSGGLPADRVFVKSHFIDPDPGVGAGRGGYALFVGRLAEDKGIDTLLDAWTRLGGRVPLKVVGDGPLAPHVQAAAARMPGIEWLGRRERPDIQRLMGDATVLVFPSVAFETFGQVIIEAYAGGTPVVVSDAGAAAELVDVGRTGVLMRSGDAGHLAAQVSSFFGGEHDLDFMRAAARATFEARYTGPPSYEGLMEIYGSAMARAALRRGGLPSRPESLRTQEAGQ